MSRWAWAAVAIGMAVQPAVAGKAPRLTVLYAFGSAAGDGLHPSGHLTQAASGEFYGVTRDGGAYGLGTVYRLSPPAQAGGAWAETVLWSFQKRGAVRADGQVDGTHPSGPVTIGADGSLYGTTETGGARQLGTVWRLVPPAEGGTAWSETVLYAFRDDGVDVATPKGGVIFDKAGHLLVTASAGQCAKGGVCQATGGVAKLVPKGQAGKTLWNETVVWNFGGAGDGAVPEGQLQPASSKGQHGVHSDEYILTTRAGGAFGEGALIQLVPPVDADSPWTEAVWHSFDGSTDGGEPGGFLSVANLGSFYGAAAGGGAYGQGTTFQFYATFLGNVWTFVTSANIGVGVGPVTPLAGLDGVTTFGGNAADCGGSYQSGCGLVFHVQGGTTPPFPETALLNFTRGRGANPQAGLIQAQDVLDYGVTYRGGAHGGGTAFRFNPADGG